jgi:hypothetical protein
LRFLSLCFASVFPVRFEDHIFPGDGALTAPVTMMIRNKAVMIPVMLYKMIIATAVVGDGPSKLPPPLPLPFDCC